MANKFIIVPEQSYRGLLNKRSDEPITRNTAISDDFDEKTNFNFVKKKLGATKSKRRRNLSTKNILYNRWLQNYLRMRKQLVNKPVKVEMTENGPKILVNSKTADVKDSAIRALINEKGELEPITDQAGKPPIKPKNEAAPIFDFAEAKTEKTQNSTHSPVAKPNASSNKSVITEPVETTVYNKDGTPKISRTQSERRRKQAENEAKIITIEQKLFELIMKNPAAFGVTHDEQIINPKTNNPVHQSHLRRSIIRMIEPSPKNAPSPPGMKFLKSKLLENDQTRRLLEWKTTTATESPQQKGSGRVKRVRLLIPFKPSKWEKRMMKRSKNAKARK